MACCAFLAWRRNTDARKLGSDGHVDPEMAWAREWFRNESSNFNSIVWVGETGSSSLQRRVSMEKWAMCEKMRA